MSVASSIAKLQAQVLALETTLIKVSQLPNQSSHSDVTQQYLCAFKVFDEKINLIFQQLSEGSEERATSTPGIYP